MTTRKKPCNEATATAREGLPPVYYRVYALLQTIRALASHEDELCSLLAEIQRTGRIGPRSQRALSELLHSLPAMSLHAEIEQAFSALDAAA